MPVFIDPGESGQPARNTLLNLLAAKQAAMQEAMGAPTAMRDAVGGWAQPAAEGGWEAQAAESYARQRLAQAERAGLLPANSFVNPSLTAAATWRNISGRIAQAAAQHGYRDAGHWLDLGAPRTHVPGEGRLVRQLADRRQAGQWVRA